jgi:CheY-like chemotaxis protein
MREEGDIAGMRTDPTKTRKYHTVFINVMSNIARNFGAKIIKNVRNCLIIYFPRTSNLLDFPAFADVIECGLTMLAAESAINEKLINKNIAAVSCRISADYGMVEVAKLRTSKEEDLFGATMNLCAKINSAAPANNLVIGGDLFLVLRSFFSHPSFKQANYQFKEIRGYSVSGPLQYPTYLVKSRNNRTYHISDAYLSELDDKYNIITADKKEFPHSSCSDYNIMLIDDDKDILYNFTECLAIAGYRSEAFTDPHEALERFAQMDHPSFDLVILDLRMPNINGIELYTKLKSINREIKVLVASALDVVQELVSIFPEIVKDDILRKPIDMNDFINNIKRKLPVQE